MINGIKAICITEVAYDANNPSIPIWATRYQLTEGIELPSGGLHNNGGVDTPIGLLTESTFNLTIQQAIADAINAQTSNVAQAYAGDVYGGRI